MGKLSSFLQLPICGATEAVVKGGMTVGPTSENCIFSNSGQFFLHAKWCNFQHYVVLAREAQGERNSHCADVPST